MDTEHNGFGRYEQERHPSAEVEGISVVRRSKRCEPLGEWLDSGLVRDWTSSARRVGQSSPRSPIADAVEGARWILELEDDWDEAGALRYEEAVFERAAKFLRNSAAWLERTYGRTLPPPDIGPGPDGCIDLHWKLPHVELLLKVPPASAPITFYGDDRSGFVVRGSTVESGGPLFLWLTSSSPT